VVVRLSGVDKWILPVRSKGSGYSDCGFGENRGEVGQFELHSEFVSFKRRMSSPRYENMRRHISTGRGGEDDFAGKVSEMQCSSPILVFSENVGESTALRLERARRGKIFFQIASFRRCGYPAKRHV